MSRKNIRKTLIKPLQSKKTVVSRRIIKRSSAKGHSLVVTPELYLSNESFSNSIKTSKEKLSFFNALDAYALLEFNLVKNNNLPTINMVFHGHWGWVFSQMVENYKKHLSSCNIISSVNPIEGCDVYQYWRPANKGMQIMINTFPPTHDFLRKGIHMIHDSPCDTSRANTQFRKKSIGSFHSIICTSLEQFNYYREFKASAKMWYVPLGIGNDIVKKTTINKNNKIRLGFVGRLYADKVKGEDDLVKLAKLLPNDKFEFIILSPNAQSYINKLKNELGFTVYSNKDGAFHKMYKKIDVTLILSKYEGTPLPLIESIGLGNYVLANDVGEASVILSNEHIIKSIKDLVNKLDMIYTDRSILQNFLEKSNRLIKDRTLKNFVTQTENIWKTIW
jgi:hypothetical protein